MSFAAAAGLPGMSNDVWPLVHSERRALIADLEQLDDAQWEQPSLCDGWTVHDVVAHRIHSAKTTRIGFLVEMARARFDFDLHNARGVRQECGTTPRQTLERLRRVAALTSTPPAPRNTRLVEAVVHGEDIRRPLGITRVYPREAVLRSLRQQARTSVSFGGARELVAGVRLTATDVDFSLGAGPEARGPALALLLVMSGRRVALGELTGAAVAALA